MKVDVTGGADPEKAVDSGGFVRRSVTVQLRADAAAPLYFGHTSDEANADDAVELNPGDVWEFDLSDGKELWHFAETTTSYVLLGL